MRLKELDGQERSIQDDKNEIDEARQAAEAELGEVKGQLKGLEGLQADMRELEHSRPRSQTAGTPKPSLRGICERYWVGAGALWR